MKELKAHLWERHPEDFYVEPQWCSQRLFSNVAFSGPVYDPACGLGRIVQAARDAGYGCVGSDIVSRSSYCFAIEDFLVYRGKSHDCIVSNPPFGIAAIFAEKALSVARYDVALLLPSKWLYGDARSRWLETTPLLKVLALTPRPSMPPGPVIEAGIEPGSGREDFSWFIWRIGHVGPWTGGWLRRDG